jgi:hypothetical protein
MAELIDSFGFVFNLKKTEEATEDYLQHFQEALQKSESEKETQE